MSPTADDDASPREYIATVQEYLVANGWEVDETQVSETVFLIRGQAPTDDGTTRLGVGIVAAGPTDALARSHLEYLQKAVTEYDADTAFAHGRCGTSDEVAELCDQHGIRLISLDDGGSTPQAGGPSETESRTQGGATLNPTSKAEAAGTTAETGTPQQRGAPSESNAVFRQQFFQGALHGAGAWILGYVVTVALSRFDDFGVANEFLFRGPGWIFYAMHHVQIQVRGTLYGSSAHSTIPIFGSPLSLGARGTTVPQLVYFLLPVVILLGAGYRLAKTTHERDLSVTAAVRLGTTMVPGYLVMMLGGLSLFVADSSQPAIPGGESATLIIAPAFVPSLLQGGLLYPLAFGVLGALIARYR